MTLAVFGTRREGTNQNKTKQETIVAFFVACRHPANSYQLPAAVEARTPILSHVTTILTQRWCKQSSKAVH
jgi:hypothetical protein